MLNQNIISNKFNLKLVITFSSYWCTAILMKSRSLHYVLKKQRKLISTKVKTTLKWHWGKERWLPNQHTKREDNVRRIIKLSNSLQGYQNRTPKALTFKEKITLPETTCKNINKRFPESRTENDVRKWHSRKFTQHSKKLRNHRSSNKRI